MFDKGKEALSISLKTTLIFNGQVGMVGSVRNHPFVELIYLLAKLLEVPFLESILLNSFENGDKQVLDLQDEGFKFTIEGAFQRSSFRSRMRWTRHFCCRHFIES